MVFHLGIEHHKVNDALRKDGFRLLLNQIKSEPYDLKERVGKMFPVEAASKDGGGKEIDMEEEDPCDDERADVAGFTKDYLQRTSLHGLQ